MTERARPTGIITFLFTDIEGSTRLWDAHRDVMAAALRDHDAMLRTAIESNGGHVFKTIGDAFCAAFESPASALDAAIVAQRALAAHPWGETGALRARVAIHTGEAEERDADYFGPTVNRVARLLAAGHGGQVLLTQSAVDLLDSTLMEGVSLRDLGERRLKDLRQPERVFQLVAPGLAEDFAPLTTLDARPNNLPAQATPLLGRDAELDDVTSRLRQPGTKILTLTGPGGTGKTRLALQTAADLIDNFVHGVWFVDLSAVTDPALVPAEIAAALSISEEGGDSIDKQLLAHLRAKELLLVLDNFEQLLTAGKQISLLRAECPGVKLLVTSRAPLRITGEQEYPVPPLGVPDTRRLPDFEHLLAYPAVELFVQRAAAIKHDFALTPESSRAVAQICADLDGLPLAIELAAARIRLLPPQAMLARLESRLKLLTGGARDRPERQQTLRGAIAWSYDLLPESERLLLSRLSVFAGGCDFEAAEAVCNLDGGLDLFEGLEQLVQHSLLRQEETASGEPRFRMLATIREFALEQLDAIGETETVRTAHAEYFLAFAEKGRPALRGPDQAVWLDQLQAEHDNLRLALDTFDVAGNGVSELRVADALWGFWLIRGHLTEGLNRLEQALAHGSDAAPATRAVAMDGAGIIAHTRGNDELAIQLHSSALELFQAIGDLEGVASALDNLGAVVQRGQQPDLARARAYFEDALSVRRSAADTYGIALSLNNLGSLHMMYGDVESALISYDEGVTLCAELSVPSLSSLLIGNLASAHREQGNFGQAMSLYGVALDSLQEIGDLEGIVDIVTGIAQVACATGQHEEAAHLLGAADALQREIGYTLDPIDQTSLRQAETDATLALGTDRFAECWEKGANTPIDRTIDGAKRLTSTAITQPIG